MDAEPLAQELSKWPKLECVRVLLRWGWRAVGSVPEFYLRGEQRLFAESAIHRPRSYFHVLCKFAVLLAENQALRGIWNLGPDSYYKALLSLPDDVVDAYTSICTLALTYIPYISFVTR